MRKGRHTVEQAIAAADQLTEFIELHHPQSVDRTTVPGSEIAAVMYSIVIEHRSAVLLLVRHDARASAFALARSVMEAFYRAMWAHYCATEMEIERVLTRGYMPSMETLSKRLDKVEDLQKTLGERKRLMWEPLSDFAHGGGRQLSRWLGEDGIGPRFTDAEVVDLLFLTGLDALHAGLGICRLAGADGAVFGDRVLQLLAAEREARMP